MAAQPNIVNDISTLTRVPNKVLTELTHKANLCIGNIISEAKELGEQAVIINIGIGTLSIDLIDMQCNSSLVYWSIGASISCKPVNPTT